MKRVKKHYISGGILFLSVIGICFFSSLEFLSMHKDDTVYPSPGLSSKKKLSSYFSNLTGSPGDTDVYVFNGKEEGGNLLIVGGTHPNEPAGFLAAVCLIENIQVRKGRVIIIPQANHSGFTHNDPFEGNPPRFPIKIAEGTRWFRFGSRLTNPIHQWPDPAIYKNPAGQNLAGTEIRNLNRNYPGKEHGHLTERLAYSIIELIREEDIDIAVDLHEAAPEYPVINAIVFHENSAELAAVTFMELQMHDLEFRLEESPQGLRGLSHREWGDHAHIKALLFESANASHGRLKGKPSISLIVDGKDKNYVKAAKLGRLFVPFDEEGIPLRQRVARHVAAVQALLSSLAELDPDNAIEIKHMPSHARINIEGIGLYLAPPE